MFFHLVMTNISHGIDGKLPIEIDGLAIHSMVMFYGKPLVIPRG